MTLSAADAARLATLQAARDALISGKSVAEVEYNGERRRYAPADLGRLDREIAKLGTGYGTMRVRL